MQTKLLKELKTFLVSAKYRRHYFEADNVGEYIKIFFSNKHSCYIIF